MTDVANPAGTDAPAEATVTETAAPESNGSAPATAAKTAKTNAPIQLTVPLDLKAKIEATAEAANKSAARWALELIAKEFEFDLPAVTRVSTGKGGVKMTDVFAKDLTPEQKRERLSAAKLLLDGLSKGLFNLEDIKAKLAV